MTATVVVWNTQWAGPSSVRGRTLTRLIAAHRPDVLCLTEALLDFAPPPGHLIASEADYGYRAPAGRRKVILWSREPWRSVDSVGSPRLPGGRFVRGLTQTPIGPLTIIGVCIPWREAHVRTGRRDRRPWEDHLAYLRGLASCARPPLGSPTALVGDFNQRVPPVGTPPAVADELAAVLKPFRIVTAGAVQGLASPVIDHVALSSALEAVSVVGIDARQGEITLSDHPGIVVRLAASAAAAQDPGPG